MVQARFKDLTCIVLDVSGAAHACMPGWSDVAERALATKLVASPSHDVAVIAFGADTTDNFLAQTTATGEYDGVHVITDLQPCTVVSFQEVRARLRPGNARADSLSAFMVALDLLKRTVDALKLHKARKSIVLLSPLQHAHEPVDDGFLAQLAPQCVALEMSVHCCIAAWLESDEEGRALQAANAEVFRRLLRMGVVGSVRACSTAIEAFGVIKSQPVPHGYACSLKIHELEVAVKHHKLSSYDRLPSARPYSFKTDTGGASEGVSAAASSRADGAVPQDGAPSIRRETEWFVKGDESRKCNGHEERTRVYRFGDEWVPARADADYKWQPESADCGFKGLQVLCFVDGAMDDAADGSDADVVAPRWAVQDCPTAIMPATAKAAVTLAALAQAAHTAGRIALVRYALRANSAIALGALVPVTRRDPAAAAAATNPSSALCDLGGGYAAEAGTGRLFVASGSPAPDHFLLVKLRWAEEYRAAHVPDMEDVARDAGINDKHYKPMDALVHAYTATGSALPSDKCPDPQLGRLARTLIASACGSLPAAPVPMEADAAAQATLLPSEAMVAAAAEARAAVVRAFALIKTSNGTDATIKEER